MAARQRSPGGERIKNLTGNGLWMQGEGDLILAPTKVE